MRERHSGSLERRRIQRTRGEGAQMARKKKPEANRGGRPRVRTGDEVQVTVEFPLEDYSTLAGFVDYRKMIARVERTSVAKESKKELLLQLWREHWNSLPAAVQRSSKAMPIFKIRGPR